MILARPDPYSFLFLTINHWNPKNIYIVFYIVVGSLVLGMSYLVLELSITQLFPFTCLYLMKMLYIRTIYLQFFVLVQETV